MLRPAHRINEGAGAVAARIAAQSFSDSQEFVVWNAACFLHNFRRVPRIMAPEDLKDTARMLQRAICMLRIGRILDRLPARRLARSGRGTERNILVHPCLSIVLAFVFLPSAEDSVQLIR